MLMTSMPFSRQSAVNCPESAETQVRFAASNWPLGFASGDANLYRYSGNDPTNETDPTGLEGVGHHPVVCSALFDAEIRPSLTDEAFKTGLGMYTGPTDPPHNNATFAGVKHTKEYNEILKDELKEIIKANEGKKVTADQMKKFGEDLMNGLDHAGNPNEKIKAFNDVVKSRVKGGFKGFGTVEECIARGDKYAKSSRFVQSVVGGIVAIEAWALIDEAKGALDVASESRKFREGVKAFENGDVLLGQKLMLGENIDGLGGFAGELTDHGFEKAAAVFTGELQSHLTELRIQVQTAIK